MILNVLMYIYRPIKRLIFPNSHDFLVKSFRWSDGWYYAKIVEMIPHLKNYHTTFVMTRIKLRAQQKGFVDMKSYYEHLVSDPAELEAISSGLTFMGTHFFRGSDWNFFIAKCLSSFQDKERVRVWCAGCSSGEEVYSTLCGLLDYVRPESIDLLATDYNDTLLEKCRKGDYARLHLKEIPERYRHYVRLREDGKRFTFDSALRALIRTEHLNLITDQFPKGYDVILCRNVIKFFNSDTIERIQRQLAGSLRENGFLFLSSDEGETHEAIHDPELLGLEAMDGRTIYRKISGTTRESVA